MYRIPLFTLCSGLLLLWGCTKNSDLPEQPSLGIRFAFDPNQTRLNNLGQAATLPAGHAVQTPDFREMSVHYIELAPNAFTPLGQGAVVYHAEETSIGGESAVLFDNAVRSDEDSVFLNIPFSAIPTGSYEWVRVSVTYQNYDVLFNVRQVPVLGDIWQQKGRIYSFVGFNTYLSDVTLTQSELSVNAAKKQGFWVFETLLSPPYNVYNQTLSGQAPAGATTVVNPLFNSSPVPQGSCVVTGKLAAPIKVTGNESTDKHLTLSFSVNGSFEWIDSNGNGQWDIYADGTPSEQIIDMGLRGLVPYFD